MSLKAAAYNAGVPAAEQHKQFTHDMRVAQSNPMAKTGEDASSDVAAFGILLNQLRMQRDRLNSIAFGIVGRAADKLFGQQLTPAGLKEALPSPTGVVQELAQEIDILTNVITELEEQAMRLAPI